MKTAYMEVITIISVLLAMLTLSYLRHYGLAPIRKFFSDLKAVARYRRMSPQEAVMLKDHIERQETFNKTLMAKVDIVTDELHTVKRGLYGDQQNGVKGLIERQEEDEARITKIETRQDKMETDNKSFRNRVIWTGGGFLAGLQITWELIKSKFK